MTRMGGGNASFRIEMHALEMDRYDWTGARTLIVERRDGQDWREVARFHEPAQAAEWVDEAVARGEGALEDFSILIEPHTFLGRHPKLPWIVAGVCLAAIAAFWVASFALAGNSGP